MIGQLTKNERQIALIILLGLTVCGLAMAVAGRHDPLGAHGALVIVAALAGIFFVISGYYLPEPTEERHYRYYDDPTKAGIILAMGWAVFGLFVGDWVAWLLAIPISPSTLPGRASGEFDRFTPQQSSSVSAAMD